MSKRLPQLRARPAAARNTFIAIAALIAALVTLHTAVAGDQSPAPTTTEMPPCEDQRVRPLCPRITANVGSRRTIVWQLIEPATSYRVEATGTALRTNAAAPFCTAAISDDVYGIAIDSVFANQMSELNVGLPPLPPIDAWFIRDIRVTITALDADNNVVVSDGFTIESEAACNDAGDTRPPSGAETALPTFSPMDDDYAHAAKAPIGIALAVIGATILGFGLWKTRAGT